LFDRFCEARNAAKLRYGKRKKGEEDDSQERDEATAAM
jgi:hypothetical protein